MVTTFEIQFDGMPKSTEEPTGSRQNQPRSKRVAQAAKRNLAQPDQAFDVDSWEPSLLERMLKANGRKQAR